MLPALRLICASAMVLALTGCDTHAPEPAPEGEGNPPTVEPAAPADLPPGRRIRRLTADQLYRSLQVTTGQSWTRYREFSAALGRADYAEVTDEGKDPSVTFDKLATDAAMETCNNAILEDLDGRQRIMRHAKASSRDEGEFRENLKYLMLRFLGVKIEDSQDPRLDPFMESLEPSNPPDDDYDMAMRWWLVCSALATHPDFLTY